MAEVKAEEKKSRFVLPHIYVLLFGVIVVCAVLTWILPAGEFDRVTNATGQKLVVPGTFHLVEGNPVGILACLNVSMTGFAMQRRSLCLPLWPTLLSA